jgi:DNA damage-binding protein 1
MTMNGISCILLVTNICARLIDARPGVNRKLLTNESYFKLNKQYAATSSNNVLHTWTPAHNERISLTSVNALSGQFVVTIGAKLTYMCVKVANGKATIEVVKEIQMPNEIACVDISAIGLLRVRFIIVTIVAGDAKESQLCCVGLWTDISVHLLTLPDLVVINGEQLGGDILARSVLICKFDAIIYLLVALGDGAVYYYQVDQADGMDAVNSL